MSGSVTRCHTSPAGRGCVGMTVGAGVSEGSGFVVGDSGTAEESDGDGAGLGTGGFEVDGRADSVAIEDATALAAAGLVVGESDGVPVPQAPMSPIVASAASTNLASTRCCTE